MSTPAERSRAYRDRKRGGAPRQPKPHGTVAAYRRVSQVAMGSQGPRYLSRHVVDKRDEVLLNTHMTTQPVPTEKIDRLMGAPRRGMPPMLRTLVNAIEGARKDGETRYVGCTYQRYFIERTVDSITEQHVEYVVTAEGVSEKVR